MAEEFNADNFRDTVGQLHDAMANGKDHKELLTQCLSLLQKCSETFDRMQRSQGDVAKSLRRLEGEVGYSNERSDAILMSVHALLKTALRTFDPAPGSSAPAKTAVSKARWFSGKDSAPASASEGESPEALIQKGQLLQTVRKLFGPRGGKEVPYDPERAWQLQSEGVLTKSEASNWKKLGRLPDHINLAS